VIITKYSKEKVSQ